MSADLLQIISVFLLSTVKFGLAGMPASIGFFAEDPFKALTVPIAGGITGAFLFTYLSNWLLVGFAKLKARFFGPPKQKKIFTRMNRLIVTIKKKFGLLGLAIVTPSLLSLPLGCFLAVRYYHNRQRILLYMSASVTGWAFLIFYLYDYIKEFFA